MELERVGPFRLQWTGDGLNWEWITLPSGEAFAVPEWSMVLSCLYAYFHLPIQGICCYDAHDRVVGNWIWDEAHARPVAVPKMMWV